MIYVNCTVSFFFVIKTTKRYDGIKVPQQPIANEFASFFGTAVVLPDGVWW